MLARKLAVVVAAAAMVAALEACTDGCLQRPVRFEVVSSDRAELVGAEIVVDGRQVEVRYASDGVRWRVDYVFDDVVDTGDSADSDSPARRASCSSCGPPAAKTGGR